MSHLLPATGKAFAAAPPCVTLFIAVSIPKKLVAFLGTKVLHIGGAPLQVRDALRPVDAIVVLGAPLRPDGQLSLAGRERVQCALDLWMQGYAPLVIFTGGAVNSAAEAPAMGRAAQEAGIPGEAILIEDRSRTTAENAKFSAAILRDKGVTSVLVVSQPFHLRRGRRLFRQQGFSAIAHADRNSVQYARPDLSWRWISREYVAWIAHAFLSDH